MNSTELANTCGMSTDCRPTEFLTQMPSERPSALDLFTMVQQGFAFEQVKAMVVSSQLYSSANVLRRITGEQSSAAQQQDAGKEGTRLNAYQSAVAFQYAKTLEHATMVFGSQQSAEAWLGRPCRYLAGNVPVEIVDNPLGFHAVEVYLTRVELGIYQ